MRVIMIMLFVAAAAAAFAIPDSSPNVMGFYFDEDAETACIDVGYNEPFVAYLILTNPVPESISGFEASYRVVVPLGFEALFLRLSEDLLGGENWADSGLSYAGEYLVTWPTPRPTTQVTVLCMWELMLLATYSAEFYIGPIESPSLPGSRPIVYDGDDRIEAKIFNWDSPDFPVAFINYPPNTIPISFHPCGPVSEDVRSFGAIKALYR